ncbi:MAG: hypothetical protein N2544_11595 [Burkholderiales bacterium]|nr:hypothetical protein [Burkholderiales bacterium]
MNHYGNASTRFADRSAKPGVHATLAAAALVFACAASAEPLAAHDPSAGTAPGRAAPAPRAERRDVPAGVREQGEADAPADAGSRQAGHLDAPLTPCAAPPAPRFEAMPSEPRDVGDFPRFPFA